MQAENTQTYFDLHTSGLGYMKRLRLVSPDKSRGQKFKPFWSVAIAAMVGEENDVKYVNFDVTIKGDQARKAMEVLKPHLLSEDGKALNKKVLVTFRIGDAMPDVYLANKEGKPEGRQEWRSCMKGRLLKITSAKVDGEIIDLPQTEHDMAKAQAANQSPGNIPADQAA